jgi:hypothetical protein
MPRLAGTLLCLALFTGPLTSQAAAPARSAPALAVVDTQFAALVSQLSEAGAYFDTDNLISNETSYLHALTPLRRLGVRGGAYLGVGPDQNFSYIAQIRPAVAFIVDIRRDNMLQHLLLRALFVQSPTRIEYLARLHGRPVPRGAARWQGRSIQQLVEYIDATPADPRLVAARRDSIAAAIRGFGVPLTPADHATIARFHDAFIDAGLGLRFETHGRAPQAYYPTYRQLLLERDLDGRRASFLASEQRYGIVRSMQRAGKIVPVVGDLGGQHAIRAIGAWLRARKIPVSAFYTSNVEFYLMQDGSFGRFAGNVASLPLASRSAIIRSYFPGRWGPHPEAVRGYHATQLVQRTQAFVREAAGTGYPTYWDLVTRGTMRAPVRQPR